MTRYLSIWPVTFLARGSRLRGNSNAHEQVKVDFPGLRWFGLYVAGCWLSARWGWGGRTIAIPVSSRFNVVR